MRTREEVSALVDSCIPMARSIARRAARRGSISPDELEGAAFEGLVVAAERYNADRGIPFHAYARHRINGSVIDAVRSWDFVPRTVRQRAARLEESRRRLADEGRTADRASLAQVLGVSEDQVASFTQADTRSVLSLDHTDEDGISLGETVADDDMDVEDPVTTEEVRRDLAHAIATLPERERVAIVLFYVKARPLADVARVLGVTPSRVSQLCARAVLRLREKLADHR
jgi:RNA polymerase sigma factor for flagellar operon FliA